MLRRQSRCRHAEHAAIPSLPRLRSGSPRRRATARSWRSRPQRAIDEAHRVAQERAAEAEVAARSAQAIAHAQQKLLDELERWKAPQEFTAATAAVVAPPAEAPRSRVSARQHSPAPLTVKLYEDLSAPRDSTPAITNAFLPTEFADPEEATALDEEIAFRQAPVFEPYMIEPTVPLPANLLEFPRQLVAAHKARPRLAEGPLGDEGSASTPLMRIFEVASSQNAQSAAEMTPVWANIRLGAHTGNEPYIATADAPVLHPEPVTPQPAPISLRLMATVVDAALIAGAFALFATVVGKVAHDLPTGIHGLIAAGCTLAVLYPIYQLLFFSFSEQTPGMRYARLGLCTFADGNPTRAAMRRRILAQLVAVSPLGLGLLWTLVDDERLGWHDRISRMYLRAY